MFTFFIFILHELLNTLNIKTDFLLKSYYSILIEKCCLIRFNQYLKPFKIINLYQEYPTKCKVIIFQILKDFKYLLNLPMEKASESKIPSIFTCSTSSVGFMMNTTITTMLMAIQRKLPVMKTKISKESFWKMNTKIMKMMIIMIKSMEGMDMMIMMITMILTIMKTKKLLKQSHEI